VIRFRSLWALLTVGSLALFGQSIAPVAQDEIKPAGRRIVGGEKTDIKQHPWQVALNIRVADRIYLCGGSIIADRWVLTAAHCFNRSTHPKKVRAKTAVNNYQTQGVWADIDRIVIHEAYDSGTHEHDIALIRLSSPPRGAVIPLVAPDKSIPVGQPLEVTGWGATTEGGDGSRLLLKATVPLTDNDTCNGPSAYAGAIKAGMLCAGYRDGGVDSCQGDSGGPLVWRSSHGPVLVGVVSWGEGCARTLKYGVYTRVSRYADLVGNVIVRYGN
jgi:secreted trypsin-like serine protease